MYALSRTLQQENAEMIAPMLGLFRAKLAQETVGFGMVSNRLICYRAIAAAGNEIVVATQPEETSMVGPSMSVG